MPNPKRLTTTYLAQAPVVPAEPFVARRKVQIRLSA